MRLDVLKAMNLARSERRAGAIVTRLSDGEQRFVRAELVDADPLSVELEAALRMGKSATVTHQGEDYFLTVQAPAPRLDPHWRSAYLASPGADRANCRP